MYIDVLFVHSDTLDTLATVGMVAIPRVGESIRLTFPQQEITGEVVYIERIVDFGNLGLVTLHEVHVHLEGVTVTPVEEDAPDG